jgi:ADP-ribose pyrophosphatase YjhB (NUDIX family)
MSFSVEKKKAQFSPGDVPAGSVCLSTFVVARNGKGILAGRMDKLDIWLARFFMSEKGGPSYLASGKFLLPASHIMWYESPLDAAVRILEEQTLLSVPKERFKLADVQSHLRPVPSNPSGPPHWDICFVYTTDLPDSEAKKLQQPEWFKDLGFKPESELGVEDFTRGHGDILEEAGFIRATGTSK